MVQPYDPALPGSPMAGGGVGELKLVRLKGVDSGSSREAG